MGKNTLSGVMFSVLAAGASAAVGYGIYRFIQGRIIAQKAERILDEMTKSLDKPNVYIRDVVRVRDKLRKLFDGGPAKLQVLSDFDHTLSKFLTQDGQKGHTTFGVLENCKTLPESYRKKATELKDYYMPLEFSSDLSDEEKAPLMEEWWSQAHNLLIQLGLKKSHLSEIVKESNIALRDGVEYFFVKLHEKKVPVLIVSAGIGDVICEVIDQQSTLYDNVDIVSNHFEFDSENAVVGFKGDEMIKSGNKTEVTKNLDFFNRTKDRSNVIVMGDLPADVQMTGNVRNPETILSIGFLNEKVDERMQSYEDAFDIVVVDDHSIELVDLLLMKILDL